MSVPLIWRSQRNIFLKSSSVCILTKYQGNILWVTLEVRKQKFKNNKS